MMGNDDDDVGDDDEDEASTAAAAAPATEPMVLLKTDSPVTVPAASEQRNVESRLPNVEVNETDSLLVKRGFIFCDPNTAEKLDGRVFAVAFGPISELSTDPLSSLSAAQPDILSKLSRTRPNRSRTAFRKQEKDLELLLRILPFENPYGNFLLLIRNNRLVSHEFR